jgi:hypothetical protein
MSKQRCKSGWNSYFGICLSQLLFDILLGPGREWGEGGAIERQCILLSSDRGNWLLTRANLMFLPKAWNLSIVGGLVWEPGSDIATLFPPKEPSTKNRIGDQDRELNEEES